MASETIFVTTDDLRRIPRLGPERAPTKARRDQASRGLLNLFTRFRLLHSDAAIDWNNYPVPPGEGDSSQEVWLQTENGHRLIVTTSECCYGGWQAHRLELSWLAESEPAADDPSPRTLESITCILGSNNRPEMEWDFATGMGKIPFGPEEAACLGWVLLSSQSAA